MGIAIVALLVLVIVAVVAIPIMLRVVGEAARRDPNASEDEEVAEDNEGDQVREKEESPDGGHRRDAK